MKKRSLVLRNAIICFFVFTLAIVAKVETIYATEIIYVIVSTFEYEDVETMSEHSIVNYSSGEARNNNLAVACDLVNGKEGARILEPGEKFDWFEIVGETTAEKGFKKAGIIRNHVHAEDYGGGVCQVASTINSAAIEAGLKTDAKKHSSKPSYFSKNDCEATVSYESGINFTFENTFDFPIKIVMEADGQTVTARFVKQEKKTFYHIEERLE